MTEYDYTRGVADTAWKRVQARQRALRDEVTAEVNEQRVRYQHIISRYNGDEQAVIRVVSAQRIDEDPLIKSHIAAYDRAVNTAVMYGLGDVITLLTRAVALLEED